jgi:hypothetical protein
VLGLFSAAVPVAQSRWSEYGDIHLGMPEEQAISIVENSRKSQTGCGTLPAESRERVCRFEDPWCQYVIYFDTATKVVTRKLFYFHRGLFRTY